MPKHKNKFAETERKYQIIETKGKTKYQNNFKNWTQISNCRSWRKDEIPDFIEAKDKISLQKNICLYVSESCVWD